MILAGVILATLLAFAISGGDAALTLLPAGLLAAGFVLCNASPRLAAFGVIGATLLLESPQDRSADGLWQSPLAVLGAPLFGSTRAWLGVGLLITPFDVLVLGISAALLFRRWRAGGGVPFARGFTPVLGCYAAVLFLGVVLGALRGGSTQAAYWQLHQLTFFLPMAFIAHEVFTGSRAELVALGRLIVVGACLKSLFGIYFLHVIAQPAGLTPAYVTTHADTVLFVGALMVLVLWHIHQRSRRSLAVLLGCGALVLLGIHYNDRRMAWISLLAALLPAVWLMKRDATRRWALRGVLWLVPVLTLYTAAGWSSRSVLFSPVRAVNSVDATEDSSTFAREVENHNVAHTVRHSPLIGIGFGQPYDEDVRLVIGHSFELFQYIPHNTIYALFMGVGALGFTALWFPLMFAVLLAVRAARTADDWATRVASLSCIGFVLIFALQQWGDMGSQSFPPVLAAALAFGLSARLAVKAGSWPVALARACEPALSEAR